MIVDWGWGFGLWPWEEQDDDHDHDDEENEMLSTRSRSTILWFRLDLGTYLDSAQKRRTKGKEGGKPVEEKIITAPKGITWFTVNVILDILFPGAGFPLPFSYLIRPYS